MKLLGIFVMFLSTAFSTIEWDGAKMVRSEQEWLTALGPDRYRTMRKKGSDRAYIGKYAYLPATPGTYHCAGCGLGLFHSQDQYEAGGGFPSFKYPIHSKNVYYSEDFSLPFKRYEVLCRKCDSHLGHLFHDGPPLKYFRYCVNSTALQYVKSKLSQNNR